MGAADLVVCRVCVMLLCSVVLLSNLRVVLCCVADGENVFADPDSKLSKYGPKAWKTSPNVSVFITFLLYGFLTLICLYVYSCLVIIRAVIKQIRCDVKV